MDARLLEILLVGVSVLLIAVVQSWAYDCLFREARRVLGVKRGLQNLDR